MRRYLACLVALATMLFAPSVAHAAIQRYGSDLTAPANMVEAHGADSAFWNVRLANGSATAAPADGQVVSVRVKGMVLPDPAHRIKPVTMFHFQTIRPMGDGSLSVWLSSGAFYTPLGGDPEKISTYYPINMCVHKGDYLDFNDIGGNEWHWGNYSGMPFQTFSSVPGSAIDFYTKHAGTNIGSRWRPMMTKDGEELLMQMKLATGPDATWICPGGYLQHIHRGVTFRGGQASLSGNAARVRIGCPWKTYGNCRGTIRGTAKVNGKQASFGTGSFSTTHGYTDWVMVPMSGAAVQAVRQSGSLRVRLTATSRDDPRHDSRAFWPTLTPVQTRVNSADITVTG